MRRGGLVGGVLALASACAPVERKAQPGPFLPPPPQEHLDPEALLETGEVELALTMLERNLRDAESPRDLALYGRALRMRGRLAEAQTALEKALSRDGRLGDMALRELAQIALEQEFYPEAVRRLRQLGPAPQDRPLLRFLEGFRGRPHERLSGGRAVLPLTGEDLPQVRVRLEGHAEAELVVDTGASFTVLSVSLARRIGLFTKVEGGVLIDLEGRPLEVSYAEVGTLDLGPMRIARVPVLLVEDDALRLRLLGRTPVFATEGVLGMSLLRHFRFTLDFPERSLELVQAGVEPVSGGLPLFSTGFSLYLHVSPGGGPPLPFRLDTGSTQSCLTPYGLAPAGLEGKAVTKIEYVAGTEGPGASLRQVMGLDLQVGDFWIRNLRLPVLTAVDPAGVRVGGVVGADLLRHFRLIVDPYLMTCALER